VRSHLPERKDEGRAEGESPDVAKRVGTSRRRVPEFPNPDEPKARPQRRGGSPWRCPRVRRGGPGRSGPAPPGHKKESGPGGAWPPEPPYRPHSLWFRATRYGHRFASGFATHDDHWLRAAGEVGKPPRALQCEPHGIRAIGTLHDGVLLRSCRHSGVNDVRLKRTPPPGECFRCGVTARPKPPRQALLCRAHTGAPVSDHPGIRSFAPPSHGGHHLAM